MTLYAITPRGAECGLRCGSCYWWQPTGLDANAKGKCTEDYELDGFIYTGQWQTCTLWANDYVVRR